MNNAHDDIETIRCVDSRYVDAEPDLKLAAGETGEGADFIELNRGCCCGGYSKAF